MICFWEDAQNNEHNEHGCAPEENIETPFDVEIFCDGAFGGLPTYSEHLEKSSAMACEGQMQGSTGAPAELDPTSYVTQVSKNTFEVDGDMVDILRSNPWQLSQETGQFIFEDGTPTGHFEFSGGASGEILYTLGLRDGDVIETVNDISVTNYSEAFSLWSALHDATSVELKVYRNSSNVTLTYTIDYS